jgi:hypothetical protein
MQPIMRSSASECNPAFVPLDLPEADNVEWFERVCGGYEGNDMTMIGLVGGIDPISFRLRVAQSHVRHTFDPSSWSHAFVLDPVDPVQVREGKPPTGEVSGLGEGQPRTIHEVSLAPARGFGFPAPTNALQKGTTETYKDPQRWPNLALIIVPVPSAHILFALEQFQQQRAVLDAVELLVPWLGYVWGAGRAPNPLLDGIGIPSAAVIEVLFNAAGFDLTPNTPSRLSTPEALWQGAKWWHGFPRVDSSSFEDSIPPSGSPPATDRTNYTVGGAWCVRNRLGSAG